ncbi:hypothetical protein [Sorangium sp. So ce1024]
MMTENEIAKVVVDAAIEVHCAVRRPCSALRSALGEAVDTACRAA